MPKYFYVTNHLALFCSAFMDTSITYISIEISRVVPPELYSSNVWFDSSGKMTPPRQRGLRL
jgi:hypothetical protein